MESLRRGYHQYDLVPRCIDSGIGDALVADGSYNRNVDREVCATGWVLVCRSSRKMVRGSFYERTYSASAYRGELLGMVAAHALIANAHAVFDLSEINGSIHCDNLGALGKARSHGRRVKSAMKQADAVRSIRSMKQGLFLKLDYQYVKSHQDDKTGWRDLPLDQQLNVLCDTLAKQACMKGITYDAVTATAPLFLPFEMSAVVVNGAKLTSDISDPIRYELGRIEAKAFYTQPRLLGDNGVNMGGLGWTPEKFDLVDWAGLHAALKNKPDTFGIWLAKQGIGVCATRRNTARIDKKLDDVCPNCLRVTERSDHLNLCTEVGRSTLFEASVDGVEEWLYRKGRTDSEMAFWIVAILRLRGRTAGICLERMAPDVRQVVEDIFTIGWVEFLHGKIPRSLSKLQQNHCDTYPCGPGFSGAEWTKGFITRLVQVSHSQWLYRNFTLHHHTRGYLALQSKCQVLGRIAELAEVGPEEIPEESRFLLEVDFRKLVLDRTDRQEYWVAAMNAAIRAGRQSGPNRWKRQSRLPGRDASKSDRGVELRTFRLQQVEAAIIEVRRNRIRVANFQSGGRKRRRLCTGNGGRPPTISRF